MCMKCLVTRRADILKSMNRAIRGWQGLPALLPFAAAVLKGLKSVRTALKKLPEGEEVLERADDHVHLEQLKPAFADGLAELTLAVGGAHLALRALMSNVEIVDEKAQKIREMIVDTRIFLDNLLGTLPVTGPETLEEAQQQRDLAQFVKGVLPRVIDQMQERDKEQSNNPEKMLN